MIRGWEESATKSFRLKEAWKAKRNSAGSRKLTSKCPLWLKPCRGGGHFEAIPERVKVVASIFELAEQGFGTHTICKDLNKQGVKPWSSGKWWNPNYVRRILRNRAVLGEFQPKIRPSRNTRHAEGPTQLGYYPAIISAGTFYRVNKDVAAPPVRPNRKDSVSNLFTGLAYDGESEAPMRFHAMWAGGTYDPALSRLFSAAVEKGGPRQFLELLTLRSLAPSAFGETGLGNAAGGPIGSGPGCRAKAAGGRTQGRAAPTSAGGGIHHHARSGIPDLGPEGNEA